MAAKWSQKAADARKAEVRAREEQIIANFVTRANHASNLLRKNGWIVDEVERIQPNFPTVSGAWKVKMPGAAYMIVRGIEALERKQFGMC